MVQIGTLFIGDAARGLPEHIQIDSASVTTSDDERVCVCKDKDLDSGMALTCTKFCQAYLRDNDERNALRQARTFQRDKQAPKSLLDCGDVKPNNKADFVGNSQSCCCQRPP